ncbi:MAG: formate--phosphoribosylaminoimidazolecarboxamide ligase, partial [Candidatus Aenigmarchaeota archaeon]|nr:formate--phosphoribosylaminoimidazolecarboxamide ligase [Candidatus Aenigmarchaeota archaeon]
MTNPVDKTISESREIAKLYDTDSLNIATLCSHSSLQLFKAAKDEGLETIGIIRKKDKSIRESYDIFPHGRPDVFLEIEEYPELLELGPELYERNAVFIPHGSSVEYLRIPGSEYHGLELIPVPTYGNRKIIPFEFDRKKQRQWLEKEAGLRMPEEIDDPKDIKGPVMLKLKGAPGGRGSVVLTSYEEYEKFMERCGQKNDYDGATMQRFIPGTRYYLQFLAAPFKQYNGQELEFFGIDRRDESDADECFKIGTRCELLEMGCPPTYSVTGNVQAVLRESILMKDAIPAGKKTLEASHRLVEGGMRGPFCLETIVDPESKVYVFEISARIVAGSNALVAGSAYAPYTYG